jgi:hypothetical protein
MVKIPGIAAAATAALINLTDPTAALAENQKQSPILLAQNEVRTEVVTKLAATRAKQELAAL